LSLKRVRWESNACELIHRIEERRRVEIKGDEAVALQW
jgi:hypothetical protein